MLFYCVFYFKGCVKIFGESVIDNNCQRTFDMISLMNW